MPIDWKVIGAAIRRKQCIQLTDKTGNCPIRPEFDHLFARPRLPSLEDHETPRWCDADPCTCYWRLAVPPPILTKIAEKRGRYEELEQEWRAQFGTGP
jgi:hypothetical protein